MDLATVDELLSTTRSVRRRLDLSRPVEPEVIERCLEVAIQAPTGGNIVRYHFVVVTEPEVKAALAELYRRAYFDLYLPQRASVRKTFPERDARLVGSASYLAERMHQVPVLVVPCIEGRPASAAPSCRYCFARTMCSSWSPKHTQTISAIFPASRRARGPETAMPTGMRRWAQVREHGFPCHVDVPSWCKARMVSTKRSRVASRTLPLHERME